MSGPSLIGFAGVCGHERACGILRAALARDRLAHALLFAGPDGIGKRLVALALAAWLHCEARGDNACGACASCRQIAAGSHPDLQLLSVAAGKKEIGVDRIRDLKRFMQLRPLSGGGKVGIIDDAHALTVAAQNALLKTLEEPPARSLLILVAHNPDALLSTVRSRCQYVQFAPLPVDVVVQVLTTKCAVPAAVASELAALSEGSPGRALQLRGSLVGEGRARLQEQLATLGTARYVRVVQLANELRQPENEAATKIELLLAMYRDEARRSVQAGGSDHDLQSILRRADAVHSAWNTVRRGNPNRQLLLEALLLRLAHL